MFKDLNTPHSKDVNSGQIIQFIKSLFLGNVDKIILKCVCKAKGTEIANTTLKKNKVR